jgi:hypothetical protein
LLEKSLFHSIEVASFYFLHIYIYINVLLWYVRRLFCYTSMSLLQFRVSWVVRVLSISTSICDVLWYLFGYIIRVFHHKRYLNNYNHTSFFIIVYFPIWSFEFYPYFTFDFHSKSVCKNCTLKMSILISARFLWITKGWFIIRRWIVLILLWIKRNTTINETEKCVYTVLKCNTRWYFLLL